ncbi:lysoplasmalogenase-like protein TMEM86A isoform X2 [Bradysia coprophila]|uniref:lysoplasmalogenase-like protein TMEM86A isoform X2 n=1 Tax=Bradysia coprophila TaxID=38358 RepID=UPI00187D9AB4|nr:lysoplasmalogenase-like protein TMEM86A isoform X2 [Bradysia coprophila]
MGEILALVKYVGPKLISFIVAVIIYFLLIAFEHNNLVWTTIVKCAPIICLMIFVLLYGLRFEREYIYSHKIFMGLIFSCFGDALLNVDLFAFGMVMFGVAQVVYASAFGWKPLKLWIGLVLYIFGAIAILFLYKNIDSTVLLIGLPVYGVLLLTMCWRAIVRFGNDLRTSSMINNVCAIASVLFVFSDAVIAFDKFYSPISYRTFLVMSTYYFAQFGITLSIIPSRATVEKFKSIHTQTDTNDYSHNVIENLDLPGQFAVRQRKFSDI